MSEPQRIWIVSRSFSPDEGGVQTYAREIAAAYVALDWDVTVFAKSSAGPRRQERPGWRLIDVGPGRLLRTYRRLFVAMQACRRAEGLPQLVHACTWRSGLPALLLGCPLVVTVHGREIGRPRGAAGWLMQRVLGRARRIVAVSETTRALLLKRVPQLADRCVVAWNGTALSERVTPGRAPAPVPEILTVCRLVPRKNVAAAVSAAVGCRALGLRFRYRIVGRGPESERIQSVVDVAGAADQIELGGYVDADGLAQHYERAQIFLHPQIALEDGAEIEGFGISVADAMAAGHACIVGDAGGPSEFVEHEVTGLVVDGRSKDEIARALRRLLEDEGLRDRLGRAAAAWAATNLSWRTHCTRSVAGLLPSRAQIGSHAIAGEPVTEIG